MAPIRVIREAGLEVGGQEDHRALPLLRSRRLSGGLTDGLPGSRSPHWPRCLPALRRFADGLGYGGPARYVENAAEVEFVGILPRLAA